MPVFYVYILRSQKSGKLYTGQTNNLARRLLEHNDPLHNVRKHTSRHEGPWVLIHQEEFASRSDAMNREKWLKSGIGREWVHAQFGRAGPPSAD